jgi:hypothetical protein
LFRNGGIVVAVIQKFDWDSLCASKVDARFYYVIAINHNSGEMRRASTRDEFAGDSTLMDDRRHAARYELLMEEIGLESIGGAEKQLPLIVGGRLT